MAIPVGYIHEQMVSLGHPVVSVVYRAGALSAQYTSEATQEQIAAGDAYLAGLDLEALEGLAIKAAAKAAAVSTTSPTSVAARNGLRLSNLAEVESRERIMALVEAVNGLIAWANGQGPVPAPVDATPLATYGQAAALYVTEQLIDAETDPTA